MLKSKKSSSPKKVRKNSKRTAKRRISNGSIANRKLVEKRKSGIRKANYNARNIRKANWVYKPSPQVSGIRGAILSAALILTVFFSKKGISDSPENVSQTDGKKSTRKAGKGKSVVLISLSKNNPFMVLAVLPNSNQVITALLKIPRSYRLRGDRARAIINACTSNPNIIILSATITAYLALLAAFVTAQTNMQTGTKGNRAIRDNAWKLVMNALQSLMAVAQAAGNESPSTAIAIIQSGSFFVKTVTARKANVYTISNTTTIGTMKMVAPGASRVAFHIWEKSVDGITWTPVGTSHKCKMSYGGFTPVSKVWVRHSTDTNGVISAYQYFYITVS